MAKIPRSHLLLAALGAARWLAVTAVLQLHADFALASRARPETGEALRTRRVDLRVVAPHVTKRDRLGCNQQSLWRWLLGNAEQFFIREVELFGQDKQRVSPQQNEHQCSRETW